MPRAAEETLTLAACFYANICALCLDYLARQKIGGTHLNYLYFKQLPVLAPSEYNGVCCGDKPWRDWIAERVVELQYTSHDMASFARDCGYHGPPFIWNEDRRFQLRCELDAAYFHLYGLNRDDTAYILDTFPIVRKKDEKEYGHYRTKDTILQIYDQLQQAIDTGTPYQSPLDPPPCDPRAAHPAAAQEALQS